MSDLTFKNCDQEDAETISEFLWSIRDDLLLSERASTDKITDVLFEKGGALGAYRDDKMVGTVGYLLGEPSKDYANKEVGFIYVAGLDESVRHTDAFQRGWQYLVETLDGMGVRELRWHGKEDDDYLNQLYAQLGHHICAEPNGRGIACNLYGTTVENALAELDR